MIATVLDAFQDFKTALELDTSFQEKVTTHHNALRNWIEGSDSKIKTQLIGSLQRSTRIQPLNNQETFDVDVLVILGTFHRWASSGGMKPADALDNLEGIVAENSTYDKMGPENDSPAIILEYADKIKVELIPAYVDNIGTTFDGTPVPPKGRGFWVPKNNKWALADYVYDAEYLTALNKQHELLVPAIKMLKAIKRNLFSGMKSYHLEVLAMNYIPPLIGAMKSNNIEINFPNLISYFFQTSKDGVSEQAIIPGSKSPAADTYMNPIVKQQHVKIFNEIASLSSAISRMGEREALGSWKDICGEAFPS